MGISYRLPLETRSPVVTTSPHTARPTAARADRNGGLAISSASGIIGQLVNEWSRLCATPALTDTVRRWASAEPVLAQALRPAGGDDTGNALRRLLQVIDEGSVDQDDQLLGALVRLSQAGHTLAGRTVLQAMLPKLIKFARTVGATSADTEYFEDRRHVVIATFWSVLDGYPIRRRPAKVAAGLALDTLHQLTAPSRQPIRCVPTDPERLLAGHMSVDRRGHDHARVLRQTRTHCAGEAWSGGPAPLSRMITSAVDDVADLDQGLTSDSDLLEVIAWGLDRHVLRPDEARILALMYLPAEPLTSAQIADELGISPTAVRQRCSRARRRLVDAVRADLAVPTVADRSPDPVAVRGGARL